MAASTYKCANCGGYLAFDPETQKWKCPFCDSYFDESSILQKEQPSRTEESAHQVLYRCQNCGSEIMTDDTTAAAQCYYCHSPVVLQGRLSNEMRPDSVLPFTIGKEEAVSVFMKWVKAKRYVPRAFFKTSQIESMVGVYYPHFVSDCEAEGALQGNASNKTITDTEKETITRVNCFRVRREANFSFRSIIRPALSKANRKLSDGIHPYPLDQAKPFADAYLSGFLAERRDLEAKSILADVEQEVAGYVKPLLNDTLHYDESSVNSSCRIKNIKTSYVLLPSWILTYPNKQNQNDPYYFAMNGCTGEISGKLPFDRKKLALTALGVGAAVFAAACVLCYFVF